MSPPISSYNTNFGFFQVPKHRSINIDFDGYRWAHLRFVVGQETRVDGNGFHGCFHKGVCNLLKNIVKSSSTPFSATQETIWRQVLG